MVRRREAHGAVAKWLGNGLQNSTRDGPLESTEHRETKLDCDDSALLATVTERDEKRSSVTLEDKGRTLWDETIATLLRALNRAQSDQVIGELVRELRAWREERKAQPTGVG